MKTLQQKGGGCVSLGAVSPLYSVVAPTSPVAQWFLSGLGTILSRAEHATRPPSIRDLSQDALQLISVGDARAGRGVVMSSSTKTNQRAFYFGAVIPVIRTPGRQPRKYADALYRDTASCLSASKNTPCNRLEPTRYSLYRTPGTDQRGLDRRRA